jgi:catechol 2,3-dioxygenase-like lactoylglutathione lyase family enzyme
VGAGDKLALFASPEVAPPGAGFHLAFAAPSPTAVDAFHAAALEAGGRDARGPGFRPHYGESYYAAFVIGPDGHKLEAVHQ